VICRKIMFRIMPVRRMSVGLKRNIYGSGQAEFRFPGLIRCSSPIYGSKNNAKWSAKKKNVTDQLWETSSHFV
jgi:hypothetical protein